jgi:hypothetical protein
MADDSVIQERVQELTWALLDEQISEDEFRLLDNLLLSDDKARETYTACVQLHADLMAHFVTPAEKKAGSTVGSKSSVLGFLNADLPFGLQSPSAEEPTA